MKQSSLLVVSSNPVTEKKNILFQEFQANFGCFVLRQWCGSRRPAVAGGRGPSFLFY